MMAEQIFFKINGMELVLDKVLVEYNEEPVFFVCRCEQRYFIALSADMKEERYLVTEISLSQLSKMLHEKITMRALVLQADKFWDITAGEDYTKDQIIEKCIADIPLETLPYEGAYFKAASKDMEEYIDKIDSVLYGEGVWEEELVQNCTQYVESILDHINEQMEILIQNCYESIITISNKEFADYSFEKENVIEIYSSAIQIKAVETKMGIALSNSDKYPFAA